MWWSINLPCADAAVLKIRWRLASSSSSPHQQLYWKCTKNYTLPSPRNDFDYISYLSVEMWKEIQMPALLPQNHSGFKFPIYTGCDSRSFIQEHNGSHFAFCLCLGIVIWLFSFRQYQKVLFKIISYHQQRFGNITCMSVSVNLYVGMAGNEKMLHYIRFYRVMFYASTDNPFNGNTQQW